MSEDDNTKYINLDNTSSQNLNILEKLSDSPYDSEIARINEEAKIGNLDDHVDITDPDYDEAKTKQIEVKLAAQDGVEPLPEDPVLEEEETSFAIEEPNAPDPF